MLKRYMGWMLAALLLAAVFAPAQAAGKKPVSISFIKCEPIGKGETAKALKTRIEAAQSDTIVFSLTDPEKKKLVYTETKTGVSAGQEIIWSVPYYDEGLSGKKPFKQLRASFVLDGKTYKYNLYYNYELKDGVPTVLIEKATWYPDNTACSFGPYFREERPGLTDKWYTFTPVDLSRQGRQEFEYVASNMYVIGKAYVDVNGDEVRVTYHNFYAEQGGNTETLSEYFTFFHDLKGVGNVEPETMDDLGFRFGEAVSVEKDLDGDTNVLLFVRNRVTYSNYVNSTHKLTRFWPNLPERKALRAQMMALADLDR